MSSNNRDKYRFSSIPPLVLMGTDVISERGEQVYVMSKELVLHNILLRDLVAMDVPYSIKNELLNIAFYIVNDIEIYEKFQKNKEIPMTNVCKEFIKPKKFLQEWRDYLIAYITILGNPKYKHLQDYLRVVENDGQLDSSALQTISEDKSIKGIVISTKGKNAIIMTSMGDFKKIKLLESANKGEEVCGEIVKSLNDYKVHISILVLMVIIFLGTVVFKYSNVTRTVMVKTTSQIMLEVNVYNRVKSIDSSTEKGQELIKSIQVLDRSIDTALVSIIKYANENEMMPQEGIIITVNGEPIKYGILDKTEDYIYVEQVDVRLNNSGMEHRFN